MVERKSGAKICALVFALVLTVAVSGCEKKIKGTIQIKGEKQVAFAEMARIPLPAAVNSATQKYPGKAIKVELTNLDGYLVYEMEIVTKENTVLDLAVDAGNGAILKTEPGKGERD
jgi:uncharacterized membrane protein YkoI